MLKLQAREFSLVLRNACNELNWPLVKLILKYQSRLNIDVNASSSNGNSALDWASKAKEDTAQSRAKILLLLREAGAKSGADMKVIAAKRR